MRIVKNKYRYILIVLGICFLTNFLSCEKHNLEDPDNTTDRLFRPPTFSASVNANEVTLSWIPIANATYWLEVSKDSLLFETEPQQIELGEVNTYILTELWSSTRYSARIKAISKKTGVKDSEFIAVTFRTGVENIFFTPDEEDITETSILLSWDKNKEVDKVTISATGMTTRIVSLSQTEIVAGKANIEELNKATSYTFRIYKGEMLRGTITVMTVAPPPPALLAPVFINFGMDNMATGWNNLTNILQVYPHVNGTLPLNDKEGNTTGASLVYLSPFTGGARHTTGATGTTIPGFEMPDIVSQQGFYGVNGAVAQFRLEGLHLDQPYDVCFFASRMSVSDNRETKYTVTGSNEIIAFLNASNNTSEIACAQEVYPDTDGNITITLTNGDNNTNSTGFYGINAMRLTIKEE
ncbi:MAG: fibronectin type III domain-containing protein [Proteiniphilum sp.]|uniref:fibronectin type III domain-containing protein n=1 Tax=Proteiniphilum sp. TaxID=1926877 RepID=UPI00092B6607|nr:fibronectin type III domain-containing protein [Proteiniphilum sp.]MEA5126677.1 fibronectin type III domain-containing protein [Proteiniphilum sp.]OJV88556.1 MAG: hypothetical protein BGO34_18200 [Bacteroidia bacterium 44-10]